MAGWNHSKIGIQDASEHHENNSSSKCTWCPSACFTKKGLGPCTGTNTCIWKAPTPTKCKIQKLCIGWIGQIRNFLNYVELMQNNGHEPDKLIIRHGTRSKGNEGDILFWQCPTNTNQSNVFKTGRCNMKRTKGKSPEDQWPNDCALPAITH